MDRTRSFILIILVFICTTALAGIHPITNNYTGKPDYIWNISSTVPTSTSTTCQSGDIAYQTGYLYVCVSDNTWQRTALAPWAVTDLLLLSGGVDHVLLSDGTSKILIRP